MKKYHPEYNAGTSKCIQTGTGDCKAWAAARRSRRRSRTPNVAPTAKATTADVIKGLSMFKNETLGGYAPGLTYSDGTQAQPATQVHLPLQDGGPRLRAGAEHQGPDNAYLHAITRFGLRRLLRPPGVLPGGRRRCYRGSMMLADLMPFIVSGLAVGAIYGMCGTGFVITYKTSGIFNFAHPALVAIAAYAFWFLRYDNITPGPQFSWPVAAFITVLVVGPLMGLGMELIARGLVQVQTFLQVLATVGLLLGIIGTLSLFYPNSGQLPYDPFLPTTTFKVAGTFVGYDQLILFSFSVVSVALLYVFFRRARLGMAMRAVVDNPPLLDVQGRNPNAVRRWAWIIGASFAAASGVLLGPIVGTLTAGGILTIIISSFGAAAIGAFSSLPLTFVGGLLIGVAGDVSSKYVLNVSWLAGLPARAAVPGALRRADRDAARQAARTARRRPACRSSRATTPRRGCGSSLQCCSSGSWH